MFRPAAIFFALAPVFFVGPAAPQFTGFSGSYDVASSGRSFGLQIAPDRSTLSAMEKVEQCHIATGPGILPAMLCLGTTLHGSAEI